MLILTRRVGETIVIGENEARFTVLGIKGNQVRIGCEAEDAKMIHREEVYDRIIREREEEKNGDGATKDQSK
jgi:carbon storage regulator